MKRFAIDGHVGYKVIGALKLTSGALPLFSVSDSSGS